MKQKERNNRNLIIIGLCMIVTIMAVGYAAFSSRLQINGTSEVTSNWNIEITNIRAVNDNSVVSNGAYDIDAPAVGNDGLSATFHTGLISPGDTRIYEVEVTNKGSLNAEVTSTFTNALSDGISFSYDGVSPVGALGTSILTSAGVYNNSTLEKEEPFSLPATTNNVRYLYIVVKYRDSITDQPEVLNASITLTLNAVQAPSGAVTTDSGLTEVTVAGKDIPVIESGDGLYLDNNTGEYYYRGANPDNYIEFNNEIWRIMSINPQGNLKIIKEDRIDLTGYSGVNPEDNYTGRFDTAGRRTSGYCSNSKAVNYGCNTWAAMSNFENLGTGSSYANGPVTEDAELNTYLNSTYKNSLSDFTYVQTGMKWNVGHAGDYNDTLTVAQLENMEKAYTWTGDIALATKSEYIRAHGNTDCSNAKYLYDNYQTDTCKITNFLYKSDYRYRLLSPNSTNAGSEFSAISGRVGHSNPSNQNVSVRPVLYLKSNITLTGNGTNDENIYKIVR